MQAMDKDPFDLGGQAQAAADAQTQRSWDAERQADDFKTIMGQKIGRRFVWGLLERAGVFASSFNENPLLMAFAEGRRNEGLRVLAQIHALCPDLYEVMITESKE